MGPRSRAILASVAEGDMGAEAFPFGAVRRSTWRARPSAP